MIWSTRGMQRPTYPLRKRSAMLAYLQCTSGQPDVPEIADPQALQAVHISRAFLHHFDMLQSCENDNHAIFIELLTAQTETHYHILSSSDSTLKLSLLILSDFAIFPLPRTCDYRRHLVMRLKERLVTLKDSQEDLLLVLWMNAVGGMAAVGPTRTWFVRRAVKLCRELRFISLTPIQVVMNRFGGWSCLFDKPPAMAFWVDLLYEITEHSAPLAEQHFNKDLVLEASRSASILLTWGREYVLGC